MIFSKFMMKFEFLYTINPAEFYWYHNEIIIFIFIDKLLLYQNTLKSSGKILRKKFRFFKMSFFKKNI